MLKALEVLEVLGVLRVLEVLDVVWVLWDVLLTFETVVMYGHFDESRAAWCCQIVEIDPKFPDFYRKWKNGVM